jgi:hypothetical protein
MNLFRYHNRVAAPKHATEQHAGTTLSSIPAGQLDLSGGGLADKSASMLITSDDIKDFSTQLCQLAALPVFSGAAMAHAIDVIHGKVLPLPATRLQPLNI